MRYVSWGVPVAVCACCDHTQVEAARPPAPAPPPGKWDALERATRRLLALRNSGLSSGRLLVVGPDPVFRRVASAGPFELVHADSCPETDSVDAGLGMVLEGMHLSPRSCRIATIWSGLAQEPHPVALLEILRDLLEPGGTLVVAVPIHLEPKGGERHAPGGPEPQCRHLFSPGSLRVAVLRAGFDVDMVVPADLHAPRNGLPWRDRIVAKAALGMVERRSRERHDVARFIPDVLWRLAGTAELWARKPGETRRT